MNHFDALTAGLFCPSGVQFDAIMQDLAAQGNSGKRDAIPNTRIERRAMVGRKSQEVPDFFTNRGTQTLFEKLKGVFENNPDIQWFDALIGYLRASGYFPIRPYLEKVPHIRILVGINVDAIIAEYHRRGLLFLPDPTKALEEFKNDLRNDIQTASYTRDSETGINQFVDDVVSEKISLRAHPTQRLHAKLYIFRPKGFNEHKPGAVITGSSNLTAAGLGTEEEVTGLP